jgi:glycosyltransferase involved in cell wall biosynthesis
MDHKHEAAAEVEEVDRLKSLNNVDVSGYVPDTEEERKLVRKIDFYLLPTIWLMYLLSYMDRTK